MFIDFERGEGNESHHPYTKNKIKEWITLDELAVVLQIQDLNNNKKYVKHQMNKLN